MFIKKTINIEGENTHRRHTSHISMKYLYDYTAVDKRYQQCLKLLI